ncbi:MAG: DNA-packaging protein [Firmicutes bacterium]|nr:DNA-packaging protein [Bacillota bacterium]
MLNREMRMEDWESEENLARIESWARGVMSMEDIAFNMRISRSTLYNWIQKSDTITDALNSGDSTVARIEQVLIDKALQGDSKAAIFIMQNHRASPYNHKIQSEKQSDKQPNNSDYVNADKHEKIILPLHHEIQCALQGKNPPINGVDPDERDYIRKYIIQVETEMARLKHQLLRELPEEERENAILNKNEAFTKKLLRKWRELAESGIIDEKCKNWAEYDDEDSEEVDGEEGDDGEEYEDGDDEDDDDNDDDYDDEDDSDDDGDESDDDENDSDEDDDEESDGESEESALAEDTQEPENLGAEESDKPTIEAKIQEPKKKVLASPITPPPSTHPLPTAVIPPQIVQTPQPMRFGRRRIFIR